MTCNNTEPAHTQVVYITPWDWRLAGPPGGSLKGLSTFQERHASLAAVRITTAPPGKHDLALCGAYERAWRDIAPRVIGAAAGPTMLVLSWFSGPIESGMLSAVYKIVGDRGTSGRYHFASVTKIDDTGTISGWIATIEEAPPLCDVLCCSDIDFEAVRIESLLVPASAIGIGTRLRDLLSQPIWEIGAHWVVSESAIAVLTTPHCEGALFVGLSSVLDMSVQRVRTELGEMGIRVVTGSV
jgi:hypothetical protein